MSRAPPSRRASPLPPSGGPPRDFSGSYNGSRSGRSVRGGGGGGGGAAGFPHIPPPPFSQQQGPPPPPPAASGPGPAISGFLEAPPRPRPSKRLILCEDGTWQTSDGNIAQKRRTSKIVGGITAAAAAPSNVVRLARAIRPVSRDGIPQVVNYHVGVGVGGGVIDKVYGGVSGEGMAEIVRAGYQFLSGNYVPNDEIFIFGFSRGAFTARSIAGLIDNVGVLTKEGLPYLAEIFRDVQHRHNENYRPQNPDEPFPNKPSVLDPSYAEELERRGLTRLHVPIKVVGVWDTVGSLGTPKIGWLRRLGLQSSASKEHSFYDTSLSSCVENAFQALALDEERYAFAPALWEKFQGNTTTLRQVWFPGAHSNVGGGAYEDQQISTISLAWMVSQCTPFLDMNEDYVLDQWEAVEDFAEKSGEKTRPWGFGKILNGMEGIYALGGSKTRTPGRYMVVDPETGATTQDALEDTHEYVHPCVRARLKLGGPGLSDRGMYMCDALRDWKLNIEYPDGAKRPNVYWKLRTKDRNVSTRVMPEAPLWGIEKELLDYDPETEEFVMRPPDESRGRRSRGRKEKRRRTPDG